MNIFREKIVVLVIGLTKSGKSTFINTILGAERAHVDGGFNPCTKDFKEYSLSSSSLRLQGEFDLTLIDTPGFTEDLDKDAALVDRLKKLLLSRPGQKILHPIIYLHDISTKDINLSYPLQVSYMLQNAGLIANNNFGNLILGTTKWGRHPKEQHEGYDAEIQKVWSPLVHKRARIYHLHDSRSREAAFGVVGAVLPQYELIVCVVGTSGSGKSNFINKLLQSNRLELGHTTCPCTQEIRIEKLNLQDPEIGSRPLSVVDTPGLDGATSTANHLMLGKLNSVFCSRTSENNTSTRLCVGFIYLHDISSKPLDRRALEDFMDFKFSHIYKQSALLVTTNWIDAPPNNYFLWEKEMINKHWRSKDVPRAARFLNTYDSAKDAIKLLIQSIDGK